MLFVVVFVGTIGVIMVVQNLSIRGRSSQPKAIPKGVPYVYITGRELVLVRGGRVLARVHRIFDEEDNQFNQIAWTRDGEYVTFLSDDEIRTGEEKEIKLIYVSASTGVVRSIPCPSCDGIATIEGTSVLATSNSDKGDQVRRIDLAAPGPGVQLKTKSIGNYFLIVTRDYVVTNQDGYSQQSKKPLQVLTFTQTDNLSKYFYANITSYGSFFAAPIGGPATQDQKIAVAYSARPYSRCGGSGSSVGLIDPRRRSVVDTDLSATASRGYVPNVKGGMVVNDLWWDLDGHLHATIATWACHDTKRSRSSQRTTVTPSTSWRLDRSTWVDEKTKPATMARELDADTRIALVKPDCVGGAQPSSPSKACYRGKLYRDDGDTRTLVADHVLLISTPLAKAAPSPNASSPSFSSPGNTPSPGTTQEDRD